MTISLRQENARLRKINAELLAALKKIAALDPMEINPNNYDADDIGKLNANAIEAAIIAGAAIARTEGEGR